MNPGYIAVILAAALYTLFSTGWYDSWVQTKHKRAIHVFFFSWIVLQAFIVKVSSHLELNLSIVLAAAVSLAPFYRWRWKEHFYVIPLAGLLGALVYLTKELLRYDPVLIWMDPSFNIVLLLTMTVFLTAKKIEIRLLLITLGMWIGDSLYGLLNSEKNPIAIIGGGNFQDIWWISIAVTCIVHPALQRVKELWPPLRKW